MSSDHMRKDFESWLIKDQTAKMVAKIGGLSDESYQAIITVTWLPRDGEHYKAVHAQELWEAWQAARETLVIELPVRSCEAAVSGRNYHKGWNDCLDWARKNIEEDGLRVKQ